jgi:hypothetical protein
MVHSAHYLARLGEGVHARRCADLAYRWSTDGDHGLRRSRFLHRVADLLRGQQLGDGVVSRAARQAQSELFRAPSFVGNTAPRFRHVRWLRAQDFVRRIGNLGFRWRGRRIGRWANGDDWRSDECAIKVWIAMDFLEAFKVIGSIGGVASAIFLVYDRLMHGKPLAYIKSEYTTAHLAVKNITEETMIIERIQVEPGIVDISSDTSVEATAETLEDDGFFKVLGPGEERLFRIQRRDGFHTARDEQAITMWVVWRHTRFTLPFDRSVKIKTTVGNLLRLGDRTTRKWRRERKVPE